MKGAATDQKVSLSGALRGARLSMVAAVWSMALTVGMGEGGQKLRKVTFQPHWIPQAQFAGFYMAKAKGFYERRGLDVSILRGGPDFPPEQSLATGRVDFATMFLATGIDKTANGSVPMVNIAQVVKRSSVTLIARRSSGIEEIKDLDGKRLFAWPDTQISALLLKHNLKVRTITMTSSVNLFLRNGADAMSGMWYNEYHILLNAGLDPSDLRVFFLRDHGLGFPEDGIYCLRSTFDAKPDVCRDFAKASLEGWSYAFAHTNETLNVVMDEAGKAHTGTNLSQQRWMLAQMRDNIVQGGRIDGNLSQESYAGVVRELQAVGAITNAPSLRGFYVDVVEKP